jgi:hypothetical protein
MDYLECVEIYPIKCNDSLIFIIALTLLMAVVVLGVSAHLLAIRTTDYWRFAALAVAVSSLTLLTLPITWAVPIFYWPIPSHSYKI